MAGRLDDVELDGVSPGHRSILGPVRWLPTGSDTQCVVGPCGQDRVGTLGPAQLTQADPEFSVFLHERVWRMLEAEGTEDKTGPTLGLLLVEWGLVLRLGGSFERPREWDSLLFFAPVGWKPGPHM